MGEICGAAATCPESVNSAPPDLASSPLRRRFLQSASVLSSPSILPSQIWSAPVPAGEPLPPNLRLREADPAALPLPRLAPARRRKGRLMRKGTHPQPSRPRRPDRRHRSLRSSTATARPGSQHRHAPRPITRRTIARSL
jgi:hypothetical protein